MSFPPVVASPRTTEERPLARTTRDAAAPAFRRRVRFTDRLARLLIAISGITIICAVLGIGVFLVLEVLPLFHGARLHPGLSQSVLAGDHARLVLADEYQEQAVVVGSDPALRVVSLAASAAPTVVPLTGLEGQQLTAASRDIRSSQVALGTDHGLVWIGLMQFRTQFEGAQRRSLLAVEPASLVEVAPGQRITRLAYRRIDEGGLIASIVEDAHLALTRVIIHQPLIGPAQHRQENIAIPQEELGRLTAVLINEPGTQLLVGTATGLIARWRLPAEGPAELLETVRAAPDGAVTAMNYLLGDRSVALGGSDGSVVTWSLVRDEASASGWRLTAIHRFPSHPTSIAAIVASPRDKGFLTISDDGIARLHYLTSERTLVQFNVAAPVVTAALAPKADGALFIDQAGNLRHWRIDNPHPEISWRSLFGKLWYEGYAGPEYVWQSTGTDDSEPKLSLVPLIVGTLKGTCYALLFAVPLALLGALYCSQFLDPHLRNPIKSTIELMAALPSVVLGFVAGVVLAPLVQTHLVAILVMPLVVPLVSVGAALMCRSIPWASLQTWIRRYEFWLLTAGVGLGVAVAIWLGPVVERVVFRGDFQAWLLETSRTRYDQRNSLIVGWAMGFAVIPIIFTVSEDAFSAVPKHLIGASLACGASTWQTAWRVVLPAAGSGVFSAIMVGFGRAVGETMIVLMATGNTPVMDWSIFNGFRALSANIAVEIPEAPYGGTLYRVLFAAALLLFAMTFVVNTVAELVRIRLRKQLQGI